MTEQTRKWGPGQLTLDLNIDKPVLPKDATIAERFEAYHAHNPAVFQAFEFYARELIGNGAKRLGSKAIIERIRWEHTIQTKGAGRFKISNDFTAYYSRLLMHRQTRFVGMFATRELAEPWDPARLDTT